MPTYAILGGTGNVGQSLLSVLSQSPQNEINVFVRSRQKLLKLSPGVASNPRVKILEGSLTDAQVIRGCLSGTGTVFLAIAVNDNVPGCTVAQDTARAVIAALNDLRQQETSTRFRVPRLVVLSSCSLSERLSQDMPRLARMAMHAAASHVYADLAKAEGFLRAQSDWVSTVFVKPGGLVHDAQKGHALSLERQQTFLSYLDLAAGMVEVADAEGDTWDMKDVAVVPKADDVAVEWWVPYYVAKGLLLHFLPWVYPYIK